MPTFTPEARALLKRLEGFRGTAYMDEAGVLTVGFGHTGTDVNPTTTWSKERAERALDQDLAIFTKGVEDLVMGAPALGDTRYSVLVIFAYNEGLRAFRGSTLLRVVLAGHYEAVPSELRKWIFIHDKSGKAVVSPGLVKRRDAEIRLWLSAEDVA
jgi:lysozyme